MGYGQLKTYLEKQKSRKITALFKRYTKYKNNEDAVWHLSASVHVWQYASMSSYLYRQLHKIRHLQVLRVHTWPGLLHDITSLFEEGAEGVFHLAKTWEVTKRDFTDNTCCHTEEMVSRWDCVHYMASQVRSGEILFENRREQDEVAVL